jgi:glycosyltransferase involved in cell wall biosynthesis
MRVLFLASYFPRPTIPLAGTWALEQAKALSTAVDLEVACCTPWVPAALAVFAKAGPWIRVPKMHQWDSVTARYYKTLYYPVPPLNTWSFPDPSRQMSLAWISVSGRLLKAIARFQPDLLFCHHTAVSGYFASRLRQMTGLPYIITDHDFHEICRCADLPRRRAFFEPILRGASRHISVSRRMEMDVRRLFPHVATETLHNGINLPSQEKLLVPRPPELRDKLVVFSSGMFTERKGLVLLINAFARVAARHPAAVLRIAGDGRFRPALEEAIKGHRLQDRVKLLGLVPHEDMFYEMAWCDLFALVSWDEPFGVVYVEAMSAGKPVIACTDSGIADVVQDGVHGLLVPPKNEEAAVVALQRLLDSQPERRRMGDHAKALACDRLTWTANTRRLLEIFEASLTQSPLKVVPRSW